jgi:hypothetical protein
MRFQTRSGQFGTGSTGSGRAGSGHDGTGQVGQGQALLQKKQVSPKTFPGTVSNLVESIQISCYKQFKKKKLSGTIFL